jgi:predicted transcriptional regulator
MTTVNDTLYYGTEDGKVFGIITRSQSEPAKAVAVALTGDDPGKVVGAVAGGAAVTAAALLFIKFFALGGLARAKSQLATNDNRNRTLDFIVDHPGSTLHEIAHGLEMNVGTIRYHLLILGMNHRITSFKPGGKFVRYFTNSGSYTQDEQYLLSLVRRDPVRKILDLLLDKAELSPLEISEALDMHDSATSRYLKELATRGVVMKHSLAGGRTSYSLCREFREPVAMAIERINSD